MVRLRRRHATALAFFIFCVGVFWLCVPLRWKYQQYCSISKARQISESREYQFRDVSPQRAFEGGPSWTQIRTRTDKIYCYAKKINGDHVEILSIVPNIDESKLESEVHCHTPGDNTSVSAKFRRLLDSHGTKLTAAYIKCPKRSTALVSPHTKESLKLSAIYVIVPAVVQNATKPVICVRPFAYQYARVNALVEFLSYYNANGVREFVFFDHSTGDAVMHLLRTVKQVHVRVFRWNLDEYASENTPADAQIDSIKFCLELYPNNPVIHVDIDEFITAPDCKDNLHEIIANYAKKRPELVALVVRNVLFCEQFNRHERNSDKMTILNQIKRQKRTWHWNKKSKVIYLQPRRVTDPGVHYVWALTDANFFQQSSDFYKYVHEVSDTELQVNHYRDCCVEEMSQVMLSYDVLQREIDVGRFHPLDDDIVNDYSAYCSLPGMNEFINANFLPLNKILFDFP